MEPITETIAGEDVALPELNTYDKHQLRREYRKSERAKLLTRLNDIQATKVERNAALEAFDDAPPMRWENYIGEGDGYFVVVRLSVEKGLRAAGQSDADAKANAAAIVAKLDWPESKLVEVVCKLADLHRSDSPVAEPQGGAAPDTRTYGDGGDDPNARAPAPVYGEPEPATA